MLIVVKEVVRELIALVAGHLGPRRHLQVAVGLALILVAGWAGVGLRSLFRPGNQHGFAYQRIRGTVLYEDGDRIPIPGLLLEFLGDRDGGGLDGAGRLGVAVVDEKTGSFDCVLRVLPAQSKRNMKVALALNSGGPAPSDMVLPIYADPKATPLEASPRSGTVTLRIKKPAS